jgi:hypothetical protein
MARCIGGVYGFGPQDKWLVPPPGRSQHAQDCWKGGEVLASDIYVEGRAVQVSSKSGIPDELGAARQTPSLLREYLILDAF